MEELMLRFLTRSRKVTMPWKVKHGRTFLKKLKILLLECFSLKTSVSALAKPFSTHGLIFSRNKMSKTNNKLPRFQELYTISRISTVLTSLSRLQLVSWFNTS